jgi:hypothetical protein
MKRIAPGCGLADQSPAIRSYPDATNVERPPKMVLDNLVSARALQPNILLPFLWMCGANRPHCRRRCGDTSRHTRQMTQFNNRGDARR